MLIRVGLKIFEASSRGNQFWLEEQRAHSGFSALPDMRSDVGSFCDVAEQDTFVDINCSSEATLPASLCLPRLHIQGLQSFKILDQISSALLWFDRVGLDSLLINMAGEFFDSTSKRNLTMPTMESVLHSSSTIKPYFIETVSTITLTPNLDWLLDNHKSPSPTLEGSKSAHIEADIPS